MKIAAKLASTSYDELVALNPGYNRWATDPDGPHRMLVPIDNADGFDAALKTLGPDDRVRLRQPRSEAQRNAGDDRQAIRRLIGGSSPRSTIFKGGKVTAGESLKIPQISDQLSEKVLLAAARVDRPETDTGRRHCSDRLSGAGGRDLEFHRAPPRHAGEHAGEAQ